MGGGHYSQEAARQMRSGGAPRRKRSAPKPVGVHAALDPSGGPREVNNITPIVVALDVTRSRGDDTRLLYDRLPELMDLLEALEYVEGPGISFAAIGDATVDKAPLQVGQFEADNRLDAVLKNIWIEEGGGGTGQESYELAAWYYAQTNCVRLLSGEGGKGFFFFVGDEGFYPQVSASHIDAVLGGGAQGDIDTAEAFARLQDKFHTFLIFPAKTLEERRSDIDAEIRSRVMSAGGQYDDVDVRISLIWNNRNDLDLHVWPPSGEHIYFSHKESKCGGALDVDRNVRGETTEPVENTRWPQGAAPEGQYRVVVRNYGFHEEDQAPTPCVVEVEVGGDIRRYEAVLSPKKETGSSSDVEICTFTFDPDPEAVAERYSAYSDEVVLTQWATVLPEGHVLKVRDAAAILDVLPGALAIANGRDTVTGYLEKLVERGADQERQADVALALAGVRCLVDEAASSA